jgi:proteasome lid subunit RPN8/RPN11
MLQIPADIWDAMIAHARQDSPSECCGLLAGHDADPCCIFPLRNELNSPTAYSADPRDLLQAHREMRARHLEIVAIYHSHPTSQARPSRRDLAENYYGPVPRIIISLQSASPVIKAFLMFPDRFEEIECRPSVPTRCRMA